jgi:voltage-gated potassium channel
MDTDRLKHKLYTIIFEAETPAGRNFDLALILIILFSVGLVILESIPAYQLQYGATLYYLEWVMTGIFLTEYFLRIYCVRRPLDYIFSFFGIIDFFSSFATIISIFVPGAQSFLIVRSLRLLRIFRILKLARYFSESMIIINALRASRIKISVFLFAVLILVLLAGTTMYIVEGPAAGYTNIPVSMYWAVVTLTTVGYGDISPQTDLGRLIASCLMIVGYAIIAVPTGIVTSEFTRRQFFPLSTKSCQACNAEDHLDDAIFCRRCGQHL